MTKSNKRRAGVRPMADADVERVLAWRNHLEVRRYMYTQHEITLDEHQRWFERTRQDPRKHLLIFEADNQALGFVSFNELGSGGVADWGFYIAPDTRKGCGRELGRAALDHAFNDIKLHKVCGHALAYNERSIRFHQTLGFKQEGALRDQHYDGERYNNIICFGLLSQEWQPNL
jgi:UDP-4-amino-4,6-dideoxy-N-acetyl-beta-L-altrosamine N-acetyltransferase